MCPWKQLLFMLIHFTISRVHAESYSCDRLKYELLKNQISTIQSSRRFFCVVPQENFTNWSVLDRLSAMDGLASAQINTDFASISNRNGHCLERKETDWTLKADWPKHIDCSQKFTVFFTDVQPTIAMPTLNMRLWDVIPGIDVTFVSPIPGVLLKNKGCAGTGNVSIVAGFNSSLDPTLQTWTCSNIPKNIISYDSIFTVHIEGIVNITFFAKTVTRDIELLRKLLRTKQSFARFFAIIRVALILALILTLWPVLFIARRDVNGHANDSMTVIASGHTTNNVNQIGGVYRLNFNVDGNWRSRQILVSSRVEFDSRNANSKVQLRKHYKGQIVTFHKGTNTESFIANYFEILYRPHVFRSSEVAQSDVHWSNCDSFIIDVNIGKDDWSERKEPEPSCSKSTDRQSFASSSIHYELAPYLMVFIILTLVNVRVFATFCRRISREKTMKSCHKKPLPPTPISDDYDHYHSLPSSTESTTVV